MHHKRCFDLHVLILVTEGTLYITAAGQEYEVGENQYIFLRADELHFGHKASVGNLSYYWAHIVPNEEMEVYDNMEQLDGCDCFFPEYGQVLSSRRIHRFFRQLLDLSMEEHLHTKASLDYLVSLLLMELTQECVNVSFYEQKRLTPLVASIKEWIGRNYHKPFMVSDIAKDYGYQANYLSTVFKQGLGMSIISYTNKLRIEAAKNLLETYELSAKETAYSCGFCDEKYFMRVFKKMVGCTPTEYKQNN